MKVAIYTRVSTLGKGQDVEVQARELREFASRRGWTIVQEFSDTGNLDHCRKQSVFGK